MNKTYKYYLLTSFAIIIFALAAGFSRLFFYDKEYKILSQKNIVIEKKESQEVNDTNDIKIIEEDTLSEDLEKQLNDFKGYLDSIVPEQLEHYQTSITDALLAYNNNLALFVDARAKNAKFSISHIEGAINIPYKSDITEYNTELIDSLRTVNLPIIIYCNNEECYSADYLGKQLKGEDIDLYETPVLWFKEGFDVWEENGYPVKVVPQETISTNIEGVKAFSVLDNIDVDDYVLLLSLLLILIIYLKSGFTKYIPIIASLLLSYIFIFYSYDKILDPLNFSKIINNYGIIPVEISIGNFSLYLLNLGCLVLPWIEMFIGLVFLVNAYKMIYGNNRLNSITDASAIISILLLIMFIVMLFIAFKNGKSIECGCKIQELDEFDKVAIRFKMLKRIVVDFFLLGIAMIVKYRGKFI